MAINMWFYQVKEFYLITGGGNKSLPVNRIKQLQIEHDYHNFIVPVIRVVMVLEPDLYYRIVSNKNSAKIQLRIDKYYKANQSDTSKSKGAGTAISGLFDLIMDDNTNDLLFSQSTEAAIKNYKKVKESRMNDLKWTSNEIEFFLFRSRSLEWLKQKNLNVILRDATVADAIAYVISRTGMEDILFAQPNNTAVYDVLLIPPSTTLQALKFIDIYYGIYSTGTVFYFDHNYGYIIPFSGDCNAWRDDYDRRVNITIPRTSDTYRTHIYGEEGYGSSVRTFTADYRSLDARNESITNNYIIGNDVDIIDPYDGSSMSGTSGATARSGNFIKLLENKTMNTMLAKMYTAQSRSGSSVISAHLQNADITVFTPNKEYSLEIDETKFSGEYKGKYMIAKCTHTFMNTGADFTVDTMCEFRRE